MTADILLSRLDRVRSTGPNSWRADCPCGHRSHGTLAITETGDGTLILHDFAGCSAGDVVGAAGLTLADLFPTKPKDTTPEGRRQARQAFRRSSWDAALNVLGREATVVSIAAHDLCEGNTLTSEDHDRLRLATSRIDSAREVLQWTR